jgi:hypothetical protein
MYRIGKRPKSRRRQVTGLLLLLLFVVLPVGLLAIFGRKFLHSNTVIRQSAAIVTPVVSQPGALHAYDAGIFTIKLPAAWKQLAGEKQPYDLYRWQTGSDSSTAQSIEVYQDTIPQNFAVNRLLPVRANGAQLSLLNTASDNCASFTKAPAGPAGPNGTLAKWNGVPFLCDLNNYERDVIGTSSLEGINTVALTGETSGSHKFFFAYTDYTLNPDYTVFYNALDSFQVK